MIVDGVQGRPPRRPGHREAHGGLEAATAGGLRGPGTGTPERRGGDGLVDGSVAMLWGRSGPGKDFGK